MSLTNLLTTSSNNSQQQQHHYLPPPPLPQTASLNKITGRRAKSGSLRKHDRKSAVVDVGFSVDGESPLASSRRGSARSDESSVQTVRTTTSTTRSLAGSQQQQQSFFPSRSLWRSPYAKSSRKIGRSMSDRCPNKVGASGGQASKTVINRGRDLSIRVLKKKMAQKVAETAVSPEPESSAAAAAAAEAGMTTSGSLLTSASTVKKKNSIVMVFNRIRGSGSSRRSKLSVGSMVPGDAGTGGVGGAASPGAQSTDFLKTFCKMSDTDIVEHWLLGIKDDKSSEPAAAAAAQNSLKADKEPVILPPEELVVLEEMVVETVASTCVSSALDIQEEGTDIALSTTAETIHHFGRQA